MDDEPAFAAACADVLAEAGYEVEAMSDAAEAGDRATGGGIDLVMTDIAMPGRSGVDLLRSIHRHDPDLPVVLVTGQPDVATAMDAVELGAVRYLVKPVASVDLLHVAAAALQRRRDSVLAAGARRHEVAMQALAANYARAVEGMWIAWQPIFQADGPLFAHEGLLRTSAPSLGDAQEFLSAAARLDEGRSLERTILEAVAFDDAPFDSGLVFVNVVPSALGDIGATDSALARRASGVVIEVTEGSPLGGVPDVRRRLGALREAGFRIALDDLGAGYAGLSSVATLEPDFVKIDMALVRDIDQWPVKRRLVDAMIRVCHDLGIQVVAEGIESPAELDVVRELGCDLVQGFLLGRPAARPLPPSLRVHGGGVPQRNEDRCVATGAHV